MPRLVQLTDTHVYDTPAGRFGGYDTRASLAAVLDAVDANERFDALVLSGDLAMDESAGAYRHLAAVFAGRAVPVLALPGNHDDPGRLAAAGFASALAPASVACGAWQIVLLDTHVPGVQHGALGDAQLAWLADALDAAADRPLAVFLHHHPVPVGSTWMDAMALREPQKLWDVLARSDGLRAVVCGHVHQNLDTYRGPVRVLATPSTCVQFLPRARLYASDPRAPAYRVIDLCDDGDVRTEVVRVPAALDAGTSSHDTPQSTARRR